jgi:maleylacetoacetate isomerase
MRLYTLQVSSAARRVEIALKLKGLAYERIVVDLAAEKRAPDSAYRRLNPQLKVPTFEDGGLRLTQSLAILEYLEEAYPEPALLPPDAAGRARVRAIALAVAGEMHALQNSAAVGFMRQHFAVSEAAGADWQRHWIALGLDAVEVRLSTEPETGRFAHGDRPTIADCCLAPQLWNALRYGLDLARWPRLAGVYGECVDEPAFAEVLAVGV